MVHDGQVDKGCKTVSECVHNGTVFMHADIHTYMHIHYIYMHTYRQTQTLIDRFRT